MGSSINMETPFSIVYGMSKTPAQHQPCATLFAWQGPGGLLQALPPDLLPCDVIHKPGLEQAKR